MNQPALQKMAKAKRPKYHEWDHRKSISSEWWFPAQPFEWWSWILRFGSRGSNIVINFFRRIHCYLSHCLTLDALHHNLKVSQSFTTLTNRMVFINRIFLVPLVNQIKSFIRSFACSYIKWTVLFYSVQHKDAILTAIDPHHNSTTLHNTPLHFQFSRDSCQIQWLSLDSGKAYIYIYYISPFIVSRQYCKH